MLATAAGRNGLRCAESPDRSTASTGRGGCTIAPGAHRSYQPGRHDDGKGCVAPRLRHDRLGPARAGAVPRNAPESANGPSVWGRPVHTLAIHGPATGYTP